LYRALLSLRRARPALAIGGYAELDTGARVLGYAREHAGARDIVLLNLGSDRERLTWPGLAGSSVLVSTHVNRGGGVFDGVLEPDEGVVLGTLK
jgi:alpha-glucosidase